MKIGKWNVTLKNVHAFVQGNARYFKDDLMDDHQKEQIIFRKMVSNKQCILDEECKCGCPVPKMFYADKACDYGCYPEMMDTDTWYRFKNYVARNEIKIKHGMDWKSIMHKLPTINQTEVLQIIDPEDTRFDFKDVKKGAGLKHQFRIFNPLEKKLEINNVQPSCGCTKVEFDTTIEYNSYGTIRCEVDTKNKPIGEHEIWLSIRFNKIQRTNFKLTFEIT